MGFVCLDSKFIEAEGSPCRFAAASRRASEPIEIAMGKCRRRSSLFPVHPAPGSPANHHLQISKTCHEPGRSRKSLTSDSTALFCGTPGLYYWRRRRVRNDRKIQTAMSAENPTQ
jgi:hypothetical protein